MDDTINTVPAWALGLSARDDVRQHDFGAEEVMKDQTGTGRRQSNAVNRNAVNRTPPPCFIMVMDLLKVQKSCRSDEQGVPRVSR